MHRLRLDGPLATTVLAMALTPDPSRSLVAAGLRVVGDPELRRLRQGRLLVGGSPVGVVKLHPAGAQLVDGWLRGVPVGAGVAERRLARRLLNRNMVHPQVAHAGSASLVDAEEVALVVPVRDDPKGAATVVDGAGPQPVYVIDDGSEPPLPAFPPPDPGSLRPRSVQIVRCEESGGPGAARNRGLYEASLDGASIVALVDADVRLHPGWIASLLGHFDDPLVAAVAPRVRSEPGRRMLDRYEERFSPLDMGTRPGSVGAGRAVPFVPTAAVLVRVEAVDSVGGFDEGLRFGEDVDLVWRLVAAGWTVRYEPSVVVHHRPRTSWRRWWSQRRQYGSAAAPLAERHGSALAPARFSLPVLTGALAVLLAPVGFAVAVVAGSVGSMVKRLQPIVGSGTALRLSVPAVGHGIRSLVLAVMRAWWPLALVGAVTSRRLRRRLFVMMAVSNLWDWFRQRPRLGPVRFVILRSFDHLAYGSGVWQGVLRQRSVTALRPELVGSDLTRHQPQEEATAQGSA